MCCGLRGIPATPPPQQPPQGVTGFARIVQNRPKDYPPQLLRLEGSPGCAEITNKFREEIAAVDVAWPKKAASRVAAPRADGGDAG